jgi:hypothetical protein
MGTRLGGLARVASPAVGAGFGFVSWLVMAAPTRKNA